MSKLLEAAKLAHSALRDGTACYRTFREVPKDEQEWTTTDDDAIEQMFAAEEKLHTAIAAEEAQPSLYEAWPSANGDADPAPFRVDRIGTKADEIICWCDEEADALLIAAALSKQAQPTREQLIEALREMQQVDVSDARSLAKALNDNRSHSVTGTEAERIGFLLQTMERNARFAAALLAQVKA